MATHVFGWERVRPVWPSITLDAERLLQLGRLGSLGGGALAALALLLTFWPRGTGPAPAELVWIGAVLGLSALGYLGHALIARGKVLWSAEALLAAAVGLQIVISAPFLAGLEAVYTGVGSEPVLLVGLARLLPVGQRAFVTLLWGVALLPALLLFAAAVVMLREADREPAAADTDPREPPPAPQSA